MLPEAASTAVNSLLLAEGKRYIDENLSGPDQASLKPFHATLMPVPFAGWSKLSERSFSTRSGSWFQRMARIVAAAYNATAVNKHRVEGRIRPAAEAHIDAILDEMDRPTTRRSPNRATDIREVLTVQGPDGVPRATISDLYVRTPNGTELYFEMKTPLPNKDTCRAMKRQVLLISALRQGHDVGAYASTAYNPFGDGAAYTWNYPPQFLEVGADFLIGRQFWHRIGEPSTYDELLELSRGVGVQLNEYLEVQLGLPTATETRGR